MQTPVKIVFCFLLCCLLRLPAEAQLQPQLKYTPLPSLPGQGGDAAVVGLSNGVLLAVAGDSIFTLPSPEGSAGWTVAGVLPALADRPAAVSAGGKMIVTDGKAVYTIALQGGKTVVGRLPSLPVPLSGVTACSMGQWVFVAGWDSAGIQLRALDLSTAAKGWIGLDHRDCRPSNGGVGKNLLSAVLKEKIYLFYDSTGCVFTLTWSSKRITGVTRTPLLNGTVRRGPGPAPVMGLDHILLPGARTAAYNVATGDWLDFGRLPLDGDAGEMTAVQRDGTWVVTNGRNVFVLSRDMQFGWVNWLTLALYLGAMVWLGFVYDRRGQTADNFFTAGGRIPWWAAGISIYGSQISAITFMAVPAVVFATDWSLLIGSLVLFAVVPIVTKYYIPFFRKLSVTSAYEYLEHRFSGTVRVTGSVSFILFQMGRMGIVLFLPATAIAAVTGIDIYFLIAVMGVICILYTVMGGIEAVVWTDVAQVIILLGGALLCLFTAVSHTRGGFAGVFQRGLQDGKFTLFRLGWGVDRLTLWVCVVGFFFLNLIPYSSDQTVVQRYLTVKDTRQAAKSLWVNAFVSLPGTFAFFGLGTVLYVFYRSHPGVIASDNIGEILPYFVVQQLPAGLSGLVIAGIFAASQSTLSASMNSISAAFFSDIYSRFRRGANAGEPDRGANAGHVDRGANAGEPDRGTDAGRMLRVARTVTVIAGVFGTGSAMAIAFLHIEFLFDLFQEVLGILGGSLAGVFILGIFTKRADARGALWGIITGFVVVWIVRSAAPVSVYLYGALSVVSCVVSGYLVSVLFPKNEKKSIVI